MEEELQFKNNLIKAFQNLSLDTQRNEFSKEMLIIASLINSSLASLGVENLTLPYNYKQKEDAKLDEEDIIVHNYMDILQIKNNLLLLLSYIEKNNNHY